MRMPALSITARIGKKAGDLLRLDGAPLQPAAACGRSTGRPCFPSTLTAMRPALVEQTCRLVRMGGLDRSGFQPPFGGKCLVCECAHARTVPPA